MKTKFDAIEKEIEEFKRETRLFTKWETGHNILDFIDVGEALRYGKLLGKRELLLENKESGD